MKARNEVAKVFFLVDGEPQKEPHPEASAIIWQFADNTKVEIGLHEIPTAMLKAAAQFGLKTKLRNSYADAANIAAAKEGLSDVLAGLKEGKWNSGERGPSYAMLPDALALVLGCDREVAAAKIAQKDGEDAKAYRARLALIAGEPRVAKALIDLKPKGAAFDLDALMAA